MKYIYFLAIFFSHLMLVRAQTLKLPVGKKFTLTSTVNNLVELTMMDNHMQMHNEGNIQMACELKAVANAGYTLQITPVRMISTMSMNSMEQKIDTDNPTDKTNPLYARVMELINQPQTFEVVNNKIIKYAQFSQLNQTGIQDDYVKLFLTIPDPSLHIGYAWSDSTIQENSKVVNQYIVMQLNDTAIALHVKSDFTLHNKLEQGGMSFDQNLKGFANGTRSYNRLNGLLKLEELDMDISGSTETPQMSSPMTMRLKIKSIVQ